MWHVGLIVVEHGLSGYGSRALEHRLSSCGSQAYLLRGMWDLPGPGLETVSLYWQTESQPLRHQGNPSIFFNMRFSHDCVAL